MLKPSQATIRACTLALILALGPATGAAGEPGWPPTAGQRVRVQGPDGKASTGVVAEADESRLLVDLDRGGSLACPADGAWDVALSKGRHRNAGKGAAIGAIVVGTAGLALGIAIAQDDFFDVGGEAVFGAVALGAGAGALVGAMLGSLSTSEEWTEPRAWQPVVQLGSLSGRSGAQGWGLGMRLSF